MTLPFITTLFILAIGIQFTSGQTTAPISTGIYTIEAQLSQQVLQVADGGEVIQGTLAPNSSDSSQQFYLVWLQDNLYYLLGAENRMIIEFDTDDNIVQERQNWTFQATDAWRLLVLPDGNFSLQHVMTAKYLAASQGATTNMVYMTDNATNPECVFILTRNIVDGVYMIREKGTSNYLRFRNRTAQLYSQKNESLAARFFIKTDGTGQFSIVNFTTLGALTVGISPSTTTLAIMTSNFTGDEKQKLIAVPADNAANFFQLQSASISYFLTICQPTDTTTVVKNQLCVSLDSTVTTFELIQDLELPLKRYNDRAYLSSHNSYASVDNGFFLYPQHEGNITYQLQNGVRSVNFDIWHIKPDDPPQDILMLPKVNEWITTLFTDPGIYVFHNLRERGYIPGGTTALPALRLYPLVQEVVDFLNANPGEIVQIEYEDGGWRDPGVLPGPDFNLLLQEYALVNGLTHLTFNLDNDPLLAVAPIRQWPLISDMVKTNRRLILLPSQNYYTPEQDLQLPQSVGKYINMVPHILETGLFTAGDDYSCSGFETDMSQFNVSNPLFYIQHMRNFPVNQLLSFSDNDFFLLWSRVESCWAQGVQMVNTILCDFTSTPFYEPGLVIQKLNDPTTPEPTRFAQCSTSYTRDLTAASTELLGVLKTQSTAYRTCPTGADYNLLLDECLMPCPAGTQSDLLDQNCLVDCQQGTSDVLGGACTRVDDTYTRELYTSKSKCESDSGTTCSGLLWTWYPDCKATYTGVLGLCISSVCPTGTTEILEICTKNSIPRVSTSPICTDPTLEYITPFCLDKCQPGFTTVDVLGVPTIGCSASTCPDGFVACYDRCIKNGDCSLIADLLTPNPVCDLG